VRFWLSQACEGARRRETRQPHYNQRRFSCSSPGPLVSLNRYLQKVKYFFNIRDIPGLIAPQLDGGAMQSEATERWMVLAEQASKEQDPQKLAELIKEINRLLEEKRSQTG
jgi:hypothetical protein